MNKVSALPSRAQCLELFYRLIYFSISSHEENAVSIPSPKPCRKIKFFIGNVLHVQPIKNLWIPPTSNLSLHVYDQFPCVESCFEGWFINPGIPSAQLNSLSDCIQPFFILWAAVVLMKMQQAGGLGISKLLVSCQSVEWISNAYLTELY